MRGRFSFNLLLALLLGSVFAIGVETYPVKASGGIYLRADGSIDPPPVPIETVDNVTYTFTDNIYDKIVLERSHIVVDGAGFTVQGNGTGDGFTLQNVINVTIKNVEVKAFERGIHLSNLSNNNTISGNNVTSNNGYGVYLEYSFYNTINDNTITNNDEGVTVDDSSYNTVSSNNITSNSAVGVVLEGNHHISSHNSVSRNSIANNFYGVMLGDSYYNTIDGNYITNNTHGVWFFRSSNNTVSGNNITSNIGYGVCLDDSRNNQVYHNRFISNTIQVSADNATGNTWDDGYLSGGNYWSDHPCIDDDHDDICDSPYVINEYNIDNYPIITEFPSLILLPLFILGTLLAAVLFRKKRSFHEQS